MQVPVPDPQTMGAVKAAGSSTSINSHHQLNKSQVITSEVSFLNLQGKQVAATSQASVLNFIPMEFGIEEEEDLVNLSKPAEPVLKTNRLEKTYFVLPQSPSGNSTMIFIDRKLPTLLMHIVPNSRFTRDYFVTLHTLVAAPGPAWPAFTPNHRGARIPLQHSSLKMERWRHHLIGYDDEKKDVLQLVEFGFPLGLTEDPQPTLVSTLSNHGSSYNFYPWWDKFLAEGVANGDVAGGFGSCPFLSVHVSPIMTAEKKPSSRRCVFDATFGDYSLNNSTPSDLYMSQPIEFTFPRIEDFRQRILSCGRGCYIWKRDLARYFLQLPIDPLEFPLLAFVWRSEMFFFVKAMFGLRNSGFNAQRLSEAVAWVHQRLGLETAEELLFYCIVYVDDFAGCEKTEKRALQASGALHTLLKDLGLEESLKKAYKPSTSMPFLGINFNTVRLEMSIPPEKLAEVREEISLWEKKKSGTKKNLQQLLGKLFWVSKCVKFSRPFMGRLLGQLKSMHALPNNKKVPILDSCRLDIKWWSRFLRKFNGVEMMIPDEPLLLTVEDLVEIGAHVNCGDAQMFGGGSYYGDEYWSRPFPEWLQDPQIFIHLKEFWVVLVSAWIWGDKWRGKLVYIFCDNDAVVETLEKEKPKDVRMQELLREFLYIVCTKGFTPAFRKINTKVNHEADFMSRVHSHESIRAYAVKHNLPIRRPVEAPDHMFSLQSNW